MQSAATTVALHAPAEADAVNMATGRAAAGDRKRLDLRGQAPSYSGVVPATGK